MASPSSELATATEIIEEDPPRRTGSPSGDVDDGAPLDLSSRSSGGEKASPSGMNVETPVVETGHVMSSGVNTAESRSPGGGRESVVGFSAVIDRPEIFAPPLPSPELELDSAIVRRIIGSEPLEILDGPPGRPRSSGDSHPSDEGPISIRGSRSVSSRIEISDDSDGPLTRRDVAVGDSAKLPRRSGGAAFRGRYADPGPPRSRKVRTEVSLDLTFDNLPEMEIEDMSSVDIGGTALEWLSQLDNMRAKSGNLQGRISGQMKVRIDRLKRVVNMLVGREARGDPGHFTKRNESLTSELRLAGKRLQDAKKELQCSERRAGELREEIRLLRESNAGSTKAFSRSGVSRSIQTSPKNRLSGVGSDGTEGAIHGPANPASDSVRLKNCAEAIRTIDDRMSSMMSLLDDIRRGVALPSPSVTITDPYAGSTAAGRSSAPTRASAPSKPRIVGNVQLVPPNQPSEDDSASGWTETEGRDPSFPSLRSVAGGHGRGRGGGGSSSTRGLSSTAPDVERDGGWGRIPGPSYADRLPLR